MATSSLTQQLTESESRNEFHRVISLQYECVTDVLRELFDYKLKTSQLTLEKYLRYCRILLAGKHFVTARQEELLQSTNPDTKEMDLTMLTMLLLAKCKNHIGISRREKECIEKLREHRNTIAHNVSGRLNDRTLFTETSNDIIDLSKSLGVKTQNTLKACIDELKQRICVRIHSKFEVMEFNQEQLHVILIHEEEKGQAQGEAFSETLLKFNLTKWAKQIARGLELQKMLQTLLKDKIISVGIVERINNVEIECDKGALFLEFLIKEGTKNQILHFCKQLRAQSQGKYGQHLADLIEGRNTDGRETAEEIKKLETDKLKKLLQEHVNTDEHGSETCEDIHIFVEEMLGYDVDFSILNEITTCLFGCQDRDGRYEGISLKQRSVDINHEEPNDEDEVNAAAMTFQSYAMHVGNQFRSIDQDIGTQITSAIVNEAIQIETFIEMTEEELKEVFSHYLQPTGYGFGIKKQLQRLQSQIKKQIKTATVKVEGTLRQFDKPYHKEYKKCEVNYQLESEQGIPTHEFVQPTSSKLTKQLIEKNTVRFITACLNARKNGTIHFGIKRIGRNKGEIVGISCTDPTLLLSIDDVVENGISRCFRHLTSDLQRNVIRCTRRAHIIQVQDHTKVVVEIDIVPFDKHLDETFYTTLFPPNGPQNVVFFLFECNDIVPIGKEREEAVKLELRDAITQRQILDTETLRNYRSASDLVQRLTYELTRGADYITDMFYPILCIGQSETTHVLDYDGIQDAFQNSVAVFDFGSSTELRKKMEDGIPIFTVKTAADFDTDEELAAFSDKEKLWVYCNGNEDLGIEVMDADFWTDRRMIPLENVLRYLKKKIPSLHAKVIFLVLEEAGLKEPMVEFAREAFIRIFKHQCIIIGETAEVLETYENEITRKIGNEKVNNLVFSGLTWFDISKVFRKSFRESSDDVCKLPNSSGTYEELTQKEKGKWKDIDILSMEECVNEEKLMKQEDLKIKQKEEEKKFYQGKKASWWNFHYGHHGERELFSKLRALIEKKLTRTDGKMLIESVEIQHEPGAGGSILGRHLIWYFSQTRCISSPYRCCVVKQITENTVREIEKFRQYQDIRPRPVIILLDDEPDGNMFFQKGLHQLAYKTASPGELFGVVINVSRVSLANDPVEEAENGKIVVKNTLKHRLTDRERQWFERKFKELEDADVDVSTLIAFNVMRNSFDKEYIKSTVETIMEAVSSNEMDILKILSLFGTYEIGISVPSSIFDCLLGYNLPIHFVTKSKPRKVGEGKPFGMREKRRIKISQPPEILNSDCLSLFARRAGYEMRNRGLCIISQPLAEVILRYIRDKQNLSLEDIVIFVLERTKYHSSQPNDESKRFVEVVCSLFKTREDTGKGKDGVKDKFSRLIFAFLDQNNVHVVEDGKDSVVRVMEKCISITDDAFVGQQLARFLIIHKKDFDAAERAICDSIALCQNNSYLLDTYGQVFKTKMEFIKETNCQRGNKMINEVANEVIGLAFKAIDKFTEGQVTTQECEKDKINLSCYHMEVRTLVGLLETFELFECYTNEEDLVDVLTKQKDIGISFLSVLNENGSIYEIIYDGKRQSQADFSLRFVEEREYQVKKIYTIYTEEDVLLLSLRERYERFYRSHGLKYQLKFGYGLKPLMKAFDAKDPKRNDLVEKRFLDAERNLQNHERLRSLEYADTRDLLFFLGFRFVELLRTGSTMYAKLYRQLLNYSTKLLDTQRQERVKRPYLEAYLFYSIFHWPRKNRFEFTSLSSPSTYIRMMEEWEQAYKKNNNITNRQQLKNNKGKNYFALSRDIFGVIDLYEIELEWRNKKETEEGRSRMHVYKDYFWREPFVADRIKRLIGTLDDSGTIINHNVRYPNGDHLFKIRAFYPSEQLRNRQVTFVLGFTWSGLRAFDVIEQSEELHSSGDEDKIPERPGNDRIVHVQPKEINYSLYQRGSSSSRHEKIKKSHEPKVQNKSMSVSKENETSTPLSQMTTRGNQEKYSQIPVNSQAVKSDGSKQKMDFASVVSKDTLHEYRTNGNKSHFHSPSDYPIRCENTMKDQQSAGARLKTVPRTAHRELPGSFGRKQQSPTHRYAEPPSSCSIKDFPPLDNVNSQAVKSDVSKQKMDFASVVSKDTLHKYRTNGNKSHFPSPSDYPVRCEDVERPKHAHKHPKPTQESLSWMSQDLPQDSPDYWKQLQLEVMDFDSSQDDPKRFNSCGKIPSEDWSLTDRIERTMVDTPVPSQGTVHSRMYLNADISESIGQETERHLKRKATEDTKRSHKEGEKHSFDELD